MGARRFSQPQWANRISFNRGGETAKEKVYIKAIFLPFMYTLYLPSSNLLAIIDYMKRTFAILMLFSVMLTLSAATYYVGAEGGLAVNTVVAGKGYRNYKYSAEIGFKSSIPVVIMFTDNLGLDTGLAMYGKNYKSYQTVTV